MPELIQPNQELLARKEQIFKTVDHVGTDMNDTLIATRPDFLRLNLAAAITHGKRPDLVSPAEFTALARLHDPQAEEGYLKWLASMAPHVHNLTPQVFRAAVDVFVAGTLPRDARHVLLEQTMGFGTVANFWAAYNGFSEAHAVSSLDYLEFLPGAREWLEMMFEMRDRGDLKSVSLVTNADARKFAIHFPYLEHHGMNRFDTVLRTKGNPAIPAPKPDPTCFAVLSEIRGIQPGETVIYMGNYDDDADAVAEANKDPRFAGTEWVSIIMNPHSKLLRIDNPHLMYTDFNELIGYWKNNL